MSAELGNEGCCGDATWRGSLCTYHSGVRDGIERAETEAAADCRLDEADAAIADLNNRLTSKLNEVARLAEANKELSDRICRMTPRIVYLRRERDRLSEANTALTALVAERQSARWELANLVEARDREIRQLIEALRAIVAEVDEADKDRIYPVTAVGRIGLIARALLAGAASPVQESPEPDRCGYDLGDGFHGQPRLCLLPKGHAGPHMCTPQVGAVQVTAPAPEGTTP